MLISSPSFQPYTEKNIHKAPQWALLSPELQEGVEVVSQVLPFRTNAHVLDSLIDWGNVPDDPMFRLNFPHESMLGARDYGRVRAAMRSGDRLELKRVVESIRQKMNPHPAGQKSLNVPALQGNELPGLQHKYRETVLFFPSAGQTCHAYCTFCFRWPQFIGDKDSKFSAPDSSGLISHLQAHPEVTDVLITGGDPLVMSTARLASFIEPLLSKDLEGLANIRIGTKALAYWPQRFVSDHDSDDLLRLFERVRTAGKNLALMGHVSHSVEMEPSVAQAAFRRAIDAGCGIRIQSPILRHINDESGIWSNLWTSAVRLGAVPYYMFVERDTGAHDYFALPLVEAQGLFRDAYSGVSGLCRTVRGPSMSATFGKVLIDGIIEVGDRRGIALKYLQARDPELVGRPFFAEYDETATWFDQLRPMSAADAKFFRGSV